VVPIYFSGTNSRNFHWLGKIHPRLRTVRLIHELFNKKGTHVEVRIGQPITPEEMEKFDIPALGRYLRSRTYALEAQCQLFDCGYTKCVKLRLSQHGDDVTGRILYAKYCTKKNADVVGADFDVLDKASSMDAYSVLPNGRVTNGYNVDWLALREVGSAEDNIPDASGGVMPTDKVTEWMENAVDPFAWTKWRNAHPAPFHLFGEDRQYAVRNNIVPPTGSRRATTRRNASTASRSRASSIRSKCASHRRKHARSAGTRKQTSR
jgi:hypothetical protein